MQDSFARAQPLGQARATIGYLVYKFRVRLGIAVVCKIPLFDRALGLKAKQNNRYAKRAIVGGYLVYKHNGYNERSRK